MTNRPTDWNPRRWWAWLRTMWRWRPRRLAWIRAYMATHVENEPLIITVPLSQCLPAGIVPWIDRINGVYVLRNVAGDRDKGTLELTFEPAGTAWVVVLDGGGVLPPAGVVPDGVLDMGGGG